MNEPDAETRLQKILGNFDALAIAVSGGVDSMTLATFAHRLGKTAITVVHAISPAVPADATRRLKVLSAAEGWRTSIVGAGEFADARYRANPVNRCYFCKSNLYDRIRSLTADTIASGANLDDLGDYRPGLLAASERDVVHPFIDAEMTKADIRELARRLELPVIAELPAQPCLASRIETGIAIDPDDLAFVEMAESQLAAASTGNATLRCRISHAGVILELAEDVMPQAEALGELITRLCAAQRRSFAGIRPYRRGAMFLRD